MSQIRLYIRRTNRLYIANFENFEWLISCMKFSTCRYPELHSSWTSTNYTTINWHIDFHRLPPTSADFRHPPTSTDLRRLPPTSDLRRYNLFQSYAFNSSFTRTSETLGSVSGHLWTRHVHLEQVSHSGWGWDSVAIVFCDSAGCSSS